MPKWGLTEDQIEAEPWGLPPELLKAHKQITDPVHGDIYLTVLETAVLDTAPMQRLRRVRQLGTTQLVYPGATHTRLSHALGTLRAAQNLLDVVFTQGAGRDPVPDLFGEWQKKGAKEFDRMVGEATVLARLGGLLHDLGHIPFGHTLEDDLRFLDPHDANDTRYETLWGAMTSELAARGITLPDKLEEQLKPLILSKSEAVESIQQRYPFVADIVGNTICADLVDYLQRDHLYTGLPAAVGWRFLDGFYVTPNGHPYLGERMVMRIKRDGRLRADVVSELFKYLRYRYELSERALDHHAKLAADVMVGKAIELWRSALAADVGIDRATTEVERQVLRRGDDGLLEHMLDQAGAEGHAGDSKWVGLREIVTHLQNRKLFKLIGEYSRRERADEIYARFELADERAAVEHAAARAAEADHDWMVALWVPDPKMRFKPADVFVDDGSPTEIFKLAAWDRDNGQRGSGLMDSHRGLWAARVYVDHRLNTEQRKAVLDSLRQTLGIEWDGRPRSASEVATAGSEELPVQEIAAAPASERAVARLEEWKAAGSRNSIKHPQLEERILSEGRFVRVDGDEFDLEKDGEIARLNLTLFFRELPPELERPDGRDRLSDFIRRSPTDFEDQVLAEMATSEAARRSGQEEGEDHPAKIAFRSAADRFVRLL